MNSVSLPYLDKSSYLQRLKPLSDLSDFILLDSAGEDLNFNRFDIVVAEPEVKIEFKDATLITKQRVDSLNSEFKNSEAQFSCQRESIKPRSKLVTDKLQLLLNQYQSKRVSQSEGEALPFCGGWIGYFSYDFGRQLESLPDETCDDIQLPWLNMGLYLWAIVSDHQLKTTKLYNFGLSPDRWCCLSRQVSSLFEKSNESSYEDHSAKLSPESANLNPEFAIRSEWRSNTSKEEYAEAFNRIKEYIFAGDCYQVNYAQQFSAQYQGDEYIAYQKLSSVNRAPFSCFMNMGDHKILSLSPERFIECHKHEVITQPIKGTRPRSDDPVEDARLGEELVNSEKDQAENLMIVDLLRNDLSKTADKGSVEVTELFGHYRFQSVHHLISTIKSKLKEEFNCFDILRTTLPGGSITGAPKIRAMEIIEELEKVKRNLYCGVIGYIDFEGNMDTNICIRTIIAKDQMMYCWAGGGLVADSQLEEEYQETFDKLRKILPYLQPETTQNNPETLD